MKLLVAGLPLTNKKPLRLPTDLRCASMSINVDLPAPDGPSSACISVHRMCGINRILTGVRYATRFRMLSGVCS